MGVREQFGVGRASNVMPVAHGSCRNGLHDINRC
jgi:hypothetical protein